MYPSIPIAHSVRMKEDRESVKILLELIRCNNHNWDSCFLFLWDNRADEQHCVVKNWPTREDFTPGFHNVLNSPLIEWSKMLLPPLHIKLGLAKQFVKGLKPTSRAFRYIRRMFSSVFEAKVKRRYICGATNKKNVGI